MRRVTWWQLGVMLTFLAGLGIGLVYAWVVSPLGVFNTQPTTLRADFKDQYRSVIAAAYAATGNLPRAKARLALLGDSDPVEALNGQAQRMQAGNLSLERADQVAALAGALDNNGNGADNNDHAVPTPTIEIAEASQNIVTATDLPASPDVPIDLTETPELIVTQAVSVEPTLRPVSTATPVPSEPFVLTGQETVCDPNLPEGLLQVVVLNSNRRQIAGVEIDITWDGGEEQFFTGLKPELGNGYADYTMTSNVAYSIQLARGSDVARGITAPTCQSSDGQTSLGGIKLTFQQP